MISSAYNLEEASNFSEQSLSAAGLSANGAEALDTEGFTGFNDRNPPSGDDLVTTGTLRRLSGYDFSALVADQVAFLQSTYSLFLASLEDLAFCLFSPCDLGNLHRPLHLHRHGCLFHLHR